MQLICLREDHKSVRDYQRLLRTNLLNWGVTLPQKQIGWVQQINNEDYEALKTAVRRKTTKIDDAPLLLKLSVNLLTTVNNSRKI